MILWVYVLMSCSILIGVGLGYVKGFYDGNKDCEGRWSEAVIRAEDRRKYG